MDLSLNEAQEMLKTAAKDFLERECPPTTVRALDEQDLGYSPELWRKMADLGWTGILIPQEYGGLGHSLTDVGVLYEEMGKALLPSPHFSSAVLGALIILEAGTEEQKRQLLPAIARGDLIVALAQTEPDYGWKAEHIGMRAAVSGDTYVLNGTKLFCHDCHCADRLLVVVRTGDGARPEEGISILVVDRQAPGVQVRNLDGFAGEKQNEVTFANVAVPQSNVLGTAGAAWAPLQRAQERATAILCAYMVGGCQAVYEMTVQYGRTRTQFGQPIGNFQRVQDHVIDIVNNLDGARWTTYEALWKLDIGKPDAAEAVAIAKAVASQGYHDACNASHEVHAGIGISREYPLYLYTKKARTLYHYLGDPVEHKKRVAAALAL
ncbi:MAG: acyl-CoA/acyl-ACP dehydrogenase [Chloroflexi bacterium]|nr:acyl-CoA/acyl-ACP dehydrogenase [Chloroflexota bacterium]